MATAVSGKNASSQNKTEKMLKIFSNVFFCSLECPAVKTKNIFSLFPLWPSKRHQCLVSQHFGLCQTHQCFVSQHLGKGFVGIHGHPPPFLKRSESQKKTQKSHDRTGFLIHHWTELRQMRTPRKRGKIGPIVWGPGPCTNPCFAMFSGQSGPNLPGS